MIYNIVELEIKDSETIQNLGEIFRKLKNNPDLFTTGEEFDWLNFLCPESLYSSKFKNPSSDCRELILGFWETPFLLDYKFMSDTCIRFSFHSGERDNPFSLYEFLINRFRYSVDAIQIINLGSKRKQVNFRTRYVQGIVEIEEVEDLNNLFLATTDKDSLQMVSSIPWDSKEWFDGSVLIESTFNPVFVKALSQHGVQIISM